jgi:hypothetical protein
VAVANQSDTCGQLSYQVDELGQGSTSVFVDARRCEAVSLPHYSLELVEELNQTSQGLGYDAARMGTTRTKGYMHAHATPTSPALLFIERRPSDTR